MKNGSQEANPFFKTLILRETNHVEITLKSCPKAYILETHRSKAPADTLRFVEGMKEILGMQSFQDATAIDRIGLPFSFVTGSGRITPGPGTPVKVSRKFRLRFR